MGKEFTLLETCHMHRKGYQPSLGSCGNWNLILVQWLFTTITRRCTQKVQDFHLGSHGKTYASTTASSSGLTGPTSTSSFAATTRHPAARVLRQHCRAPRVLVTQPHRFYVNLNVCREYSSPGRSSSTSTTPYAAAASSSGRTTTSTTHLD
jgi:hypothetical protein